MVKWDHKRMRVITSNLPQKYLDEIEKFMEWGITPSRSEYIRRAIGTQLKIDHEFIKDTDKVIEGGYDNKIEYLDLKKFVRVPGIDQPFRIIRRLES